MVESREVIAGIPARIYESDQRDGLLLVGHGGGHGKDAERFVHLCRHYATQTALSVVCIDAVDHGERRPPDPAAGLPARWHSTSAARMVQDWHTVCDALAHLGPALAYVGFSMGSIFGVPVVATAPSLRAAVFFVGGVPDFGGLDDPPLRQLLLDAAASIDDPEVLMLNHTHDPYFPVDGVHALFDALPKRRKRLMFWDGEHDDWTPEMVEHSVAFIRERLARPAPAR